MSDARQLCTFTLGDQCFGVEVMQVQEVIRYQPMTRVPLAHRVVHGLINLRGHIVTAIDLRRRLELPDRPADRLPMNIVVRTDDGAISLLVDEVGEVVEVGESQWERPPETLIGVARSLIPGAYKLEDKLLLILDTARAVHLDAEPI
jgi:purine-binding chemotaxis protein CheW